MAKAILRARLNPIDKMRFEYFCADVGISCSTAINILVKQVLKSGQMPTISCDHIPDAKTILAMKEAEKV